jgi:hypothetical protein
MSKPRGFQKGNKFGKGRPKVPDEVRGLKRLNQLEVELMLNEFLTKPVDELVEYSTNKSNPTLQVLVARILVEAIRKGDQTRLDFIFNRLIGKPLETSLVTHEIKTSYHSKIMSMIDEFEGRDVTPKLLEEPDEF